MADLELSINRAPSPSSSSVISSSMVSSIRLPSQSSARSKSGYRRIWDTTETDVEGNRRIWDTSDTDVEDHLFSGHHRGGSEHSSDFNPSWAYTTRNKQMEKTTKTRQQRPVLWKPHIGGKRNSESSQSARTQVFKSTSRGFHGNVRVDSGRLDNYRQKHYQPSFCENSLFGQRMPEPTIQSPWADKIKKSQPFMFSPLDYTRLTRENSASSAKYSSYGTLDGRPPSRQGRRPVTASTRPVTVETCHDIDEKSLWKTS